MLFWKPDALLNENSGGFAKFIVWVMGLGGSKLPFGLSGYGGHDMVQQNDEYINLW